MIGARVRIILGGARALCRDIAGLDHRSAELILGLVACWYASQVAGYTRILGDLALLWGLVSLLAGLLSVAGVLGSLAYGVGHGPSRFARGAGAILGLSFWLLLSLALFFVVRDSFTYGGFLMIGLWLLLGAIRVAKGR